MNGKEWMDHFNKRSTPVLKRLHAAMMVILADPALKREYGREAGLNTIAYFIERIINERSENGRRK